MHRTSKLRRLKSGGATGATLLLHYPSPGARVEIFSARLCTVHARSAVFDLYGDHLSARDGWAPIAAVVRLLGALEVAPPAVRTAVSRMVREGWLAPELRAGTRGYRATLRATRRLAEARGRIYRTTTASAPDWHLVVIERPEHRASRDRLAAALGYLGYARLAPLTWLAPRPSAELDTVLALEGVCARSMHAVLGTDVRDLAAQLWDLEALSEGYREFVRTARTTDARPAADPREAFRERSGLVHEWRKFLFVDPGLPAEVLPADWPGELAAGEFARVAAALLPGARAYVDQVLGECGQTGPVGYLAADR